MPPATNMDKEPPTLHRSASENSLPTGAQHILEIHRRYSEIAAHTNLAFVLEEDGCKVCSVLPLDVVALEEGQILSSIETQEEWTRFERCIHKLKALRQPIDGQESSLTIAMQLIIPFFLAGMGTVGAGVLLFIVQDWRVFTQISETAVLVPALLGLKGNLEMTSASRLCTMINLDQIKMKKKYVFANMSLIQAQGAVVATLAAFLAFVYDVVKNIINNNHESVDFGKLLILLASALAATVLASIFLDGLLIAVICLSKKWNVNPDNIATPLAASFGDLTVIALLSSLGTLFCQLYDSHMWALWLVLALVYGLILPASVFMVLRVQYTRQVLRYGWPPILLSMFISSCGGFVLDPAMQKFKLLAAFQPTINGIGGNLVSVQASRYSTYLHGAAQKGVLSELFPNIVPSPCRVFFSKDNVHARAARVFLAFVIFGQLIFISITYAINAGRVSVSALLFVFFDLAAFMQVVLLLYICIFLTNCLWRLKLNPDNISIPILTALGDFLGTSLLLGVFEILHLIGDTTAAGSR